MNAASNKSDVVMPKMVLYAVLAITLIPMILALIGVDFGFFEVLDGRLSPDASLGRYLYTILGWTAFGTAIIVVLLAFLHYGITGDVTTPIVGVALFCTGIMDGFQVLSSMGLIFEPRLPVEEFLPFSWTISRAFNALILIVGTSMFLLSGQVKGDRQKQKGVQFVLSTTVVMALIAVGVIYWIGRISAIPEFTFASKYITHPWDIVPFALFLFAGALVLPVFYKWHPSLFTHSLIISIIPSLMAQIHMALGSDTLYDTHFNIAYFLRIVSYVVPLIGLALDYERTYSKLEKQNKQILADGFMRKQSEEVLLRERDTLNQLMDNIPDIIFLKDISLRYTRINNALANLFGLTFPMEAVGKSEDDYVPEDFAAESRRLDRELIDSGQASLNKLRKFVAKDGVVKYLSISRVPIKDNQKKVMGIIGIGRDVTSTVDESGEQHLDAGDAVDEV